MNNTNTPPPTAGNSRGTHIPTFPVQATWTQNRAQDPPTPEDPGPERRLAVVGERVELGAYQAGGQRRRIVGQRVDGIVRVSDVPASGRGRAYLIERELHTNAELRALVADYLQQAQELGAVPMTVVPVERRA